MTKKEKEMKEKSLKERMFKYQFICLLIAGFALGLGTYSIILQDEFNIYQFALTMFSFFSWTLMAFLLNSISRSEFLKLLLEHSEKK
jgi:uncharacterized membrane protein YjjP (DUF1212 family)